MTQPIVPDDAQGNVLFPAYATLYDLVTREVKGLTDTQLDFTSDTWANANRIVEREFPDDIIVGWHHTHPNFGIFLSAYDLFIHKHFFGSPWNVALVVDPVKEEFGFYQWRGDEIVDCGFICIHSETR